MRAPFPLSTPAGRVLTLVGSLALSSCAGPVTPTATEMAREEARGATYVAVFGMRKLLERCLEELQARATVNPRLAEEIAGVCDAAQDDARDHFSVMVGELEDWKAGSTCRAAMAGDRVLTDFERVGLVVSDHPLESEDAVSVLRALVRRCPPR